MAYDNDVVSTESTERQPEAGSVVHTDVLVVGAGPAGLTAAAFLAEYGVNAITVTKYPSTAHTPRAHITNQRTVEVMRDLGIEDRVREIAMPAEQMGTNVWATSFAGVELARMMTWGEGQDRRSDYESASPCEMCNAPQTALEPVILAAAQERKADIRFGTEVVDITQDDERVRARVRRREDGVEYDIEARYAIGADGANSTVARTLGFEMEGAAAIGSAFTVWIEADLSRFVEHRPGALFWVAPPGTNILWSPWTTVVPHTEWNALFLMHDMLPADTSDEAVADLIRAGIGDSSVEFKIKDIGKWDINHVVAEQYRKGRVFLVGDAAHRHPPSNGLGSNTSIQDSYNLAWKLALVLRGDAGPALLDTYHEERKPVGRQVIDRAIKSIGDMDPLSEALGLAPGQTAEQGWAAVDGLFAADGAGAARRAALLEALDKVNWQLNCHGVELGQRYTSGAVLDDGTPFPEYTRDPELYYHPTTHPGAHLPHVWLQHGEKEVSTLDLVGRGSFTVLTGVGGAEWTEAAAVVSRETGIEIETRTIGMRADYDDVLGEWTKIREIDDDGCLLVRPDRHVAWRSRGSAGDPVGTLRDVVTFVLGRAAQ
ncbi:FAD-dependent oxidoreductase [Streptomyces justiciae]|uniref:FAD-dependent oxidoreductase n=1 Tax=Streptomyces justiciae TaxID=2780140 RepID=UPI002119953D|nr:FAD-dependent monooxygenase [Streptomyces justiciae]MCW8378719.1 FAD-dependent monooxygenase [Streptomyces justiciae]